MSADSSAFGCLPLAVRDSLLQQAFQQLDQLHLVGVSPRVCRLWYQLSLSIITSLDSNISNKEAAEQLKYWIQRHGAGLTSLDLLLAPAAWPSVLQSLRAAKELRSLSLSAREASTRLANAINFSFHALTNLTSLSISNCDTTTVARNSILRLTKLSSLGLCGRRMIYDCGPFLEQLSTSLVGLTKLDLLDSAVDVDDLEHLQNLPQLKELLIDEPFSVNELVRLALPFTAVGISGNHSTVGDACLWLQTAAMRLQRLAFFGSGLQYSAFEPMELQDISALQVPILQLLQLKVFKAHYVSLNIVHVAALTQLTQLVLKKCGLDDAAVCSLSSLSNLQVLKLPWNPQITGAQGSMEVLATSMPQLTSLALGGWDCGASAEVAAQLAFRQRLLGSYREGYGGSMCFSLRPLPGAEL